MAVLQSTNVQGSLCVNGVAVGGGKDFKYCCITSSTNWTPSQDLVDGDATVEAFMVAGGGGGGSAKVSIQNANRCAWVIGGGGGAGEVVHNLHDITATTNCCITIGVGGNSGSVDSTHTTTNTGTNVDSERGGNTTAFGHTAYGGGGGATRVCFQNHAAGSTLCSANQYGGPIGGGGSLTLGTYTAPSFCNRGIEGAPGGGNVGRISIISSDRFDPTNNCCNYYNDSSFEVSASELNGGGVDNIAAMNYASRFTPLGYTIPGTNQIVALPGSGVNNERGASSYNSVTRPLLITDDTLTNVPSASNRQYGFGGQAGFTGPAKAECAVIPSTNGCQVPLKGTDGIVILKWFE